MDEREVADSNNEEPTDNDDPNENDNTADDDNNYNADEAEPEVSEEKDDEEEKAEEWEEDEKPLENAIADFPADSYYEKWAKDDNSGRCRLSQLMSASKC